MPQLLKDIFETIREGGRKTTSSKQRPPPTIYRAKRAITKEERDEYIQHSFHRRCIECASFIPLPE